MQDDVGPERRLTLRRHRQREQRQSRGQDLANFFPGIAETVELADNQQTRLAVIEHIASGVRVQSRVQRHADVTGQRDGEVGHDPVRAILAEQRDVAARRQRERAQVRRHATDFVGDFIPAVVGHSAVRIGLREIDCGGLAARPVQQGVDERGVCSGHARVLVERQGFGNRRDVHGIETRHALARDAVEQAEERPQVRTQNRLAGDDHAARYPAVGIGPAENVGEAQMAKGTTGPRSVNTIGIGAEYQALAVAHRQHQRAIQRRAAHRADQARHRLRLHDLPALVYAAIEQQLIEARQLRRGGVQVAGGQDAAHRRVAIVGFNERVERSHQQALKQDRHREAHRPAGGAVAGHRVAMLSRQSVGEVTHAQGLAQAAIEVFTQRSTRHTLDELTENETAAVSVIGRPSGVNRRCRA